MRQSGCSKPSSYLALLEYIQGWPGSYFHHPSAAVGLLCHWFATLLLRSACCATGYLRNTTGVFVYSIMGLQNRGRRPFRCASICPGRCMDFFYVNISLITSPGECFMFQQGSSLQLPSSWQSWLIATRYPNQVSFQAAAVRGCSLLNLQRSPGLDNP